MATITKFILNGHSYTPRDWRNLEVLATFDGDSIQANITTSEVAFVDTNEAKPKTDIDNWFATLPTEGMPLEIPIQNETASYSAFKGYLDFRTLKRLSDVEVSCEIKKDNGLASLDTRLRGITMELLEQKGVLTIADYSHIPYIVENRKTLLEKVQLAAQAYVIFKTGIDEIHKILNIASDIPTLGLAQALVNLATSITNLILLIARLVDLLGQIQESFFPPVRYHKGISLYRAIQKAVEYCGYTLSTGATFGEIMNKTHLCPSKNDEIGYTTPTSPLSGKLNPGDLGYVASDLFTLTNLLYYTKVAIVDNTVILRPYNDPFWTQTSGYGMPSTKIEQAFVKNGIRSINYDELNSSRIVKYATDDSDLWTLTKVGQQISVTTVTPITVNNQKRVLLTGLEEVNIPYALCVRKDVVGDLLDQFFGTSDELQIIEELIENYFNSVSTILGVAFPVLGTFIDSVKGRTGCMIVENHFFSVPKIVYLDPSTNRIPENFYTKIGAKALNTNYHSYKSFVPGVRNPLNLADTNAKDVYADVSIPFGIEDFNTVISNSYFNTGFAGIGKFTSVKWQPDKDRAVVSFYTQSQWATNIEEVTI
jgi:hypothetical protein